MLRNVSLITGIFLFSFIFVHLINLSLGLHSIAQMDSTRSWLIKPWANPAGAGLLLFSLFFHALMGLRALFRRNTLQMNTIDSTQLILGFSVPFLMAPHMLKMALLPTFLGSHATYKDVLTSFWITEPWTGLMQVTGLMAVWIHACIGLIVWMRLQTWWPKVSPIAYPTVVLLPTLALLGFVNAGKEIIEQKGSSSGAAVSSDYSSSYTSNSAYDYSGGDADTKQSTGYDNEYGGAQSTNSDEYGSYSADSYSSDAYSNDYGGETSQKGENKQKPTAVNSDDPYGYATDNSFDYGDSVSDIPTISPLVKIKNITNSVLLTYLSMIVLVLIARYIRVKRHAGVSIVQFKKEPEISTRSDRTILEISRVNNVSHASLCGGRARCGTCQVRVLSGWDHLSPKTAAETAKLSAIGAKSDIRLACQTRALKGTIELEHVLPRHVEATDMPERHLAQNSSGSLS